MEPRGYIARGQYAATPPVRSPESARAVWRLLAGTNDEDSPLQISVITFCKTKGDRDMKRILTLATIFMVAGCATKPVTNEQAQDVPAKQVINNTLLVKKEGTGKVIIKRDSGFMGSACMTRVYVDGKEIADLDTAQKVTVYPKVGDHIFSAWPKGMCGGGMSEQSGKVTEDNVLMFRIGYGTNGDFGIYPTAF